MLIYAPYEHRQIPPQIPHHVVCYQHNKGYTFSPTTRQALSYALWRDPELDVVNGALLLALRRSPAHEARVTQPSEYSKSHDSVLTNDVHYY